MLYQPLLLPFHREKPLENHLLFFFDVKSLMPFWGLSLHIKIEIPELSDRRDSSGIVIESWCRNCPVALEVNLSALLLTFFFFLFLFFWCSNKRSNEGNYLRGICFILEERDKERKINFIKCICDDLQKQLINYRHNKWRERESTNSPCSHRSCVEGFDLVTVCFSCN